MTERVAMGDWAKVEDFLGEPFDIEDGTALLTVKSLDVRVLIVSK